MIKTEDVNYRDADEALTGMLAWDDARSQRSPGILVMHGGGGLDAHAKGRAVRFAEQGFVVFACDMYGAGVAGNRERIMQHIGRLRSDRAMLTRRVRAAVDVLAADPRCDGRIAAVGYCLGGMIALESARAGLDIEAVACVHGSLQTSQAAASGAIKAKILVCHGALDPHGPVAHVAAFAEEMNAAGADYQLILFGGAMHGFTHESATQPVNGVAYNAAADARSSAAIATFLGEAFAS